ncbi:MAG: 50S ribosomal protein L7/L12 [Parcubacteria group bacterium]|nr:50S ribosomal protein L7/L12 [Parcubacteria group bacterium]
MDEKFNDLLSKIESMTVLELSQFVKALEEKFGVSAAAFTMPMAGGGGASEDVKAEEKSTFNVVLNSTGDNKIQVIKTVKEVTGLGLKEAKDLVDGAPKAVRENVSKTEADEVKSKLEAAGASVELK